MTLFVNKGRKFIGEHFHATSTCCTGSGTFPSFILIKRRGFDDFYDLHGQYIIKSYLYPSVNLITIWNILVGSDPLHYSMLDGVTNDCVHDLKHFCLM